VKAFLRIVVPTSKAYCKGFRALKGISEVADSEAGKFWVQPRKFTLICVTQLAIHCVSALLSGPNGEYGYGWDRYYSADHDSRLVVLITRIAPVALIIAQVGLVYLDYRRGKTIKATVTIVACVVTVVADKDRRIKTLLNATSALAMCVILVQGSNFKRAETLYKIVMLVKG